jgi:NOL1/NOP2/fmu family ribosome biogenesis protein
LHEVEGVLYALPPQIFDWKGVQVLRVGVRLGEAKNGRFLPDHSFAMALKKAECKRCADFSLTDARADKFLRGETVEFDGDNGWTLVCVDGYPIGWGKCVDGVLKNHIPKSLRKMS